MVSYLFFKSVLAKKVVTLCAASNVISSGLATNIFSGFKTAPDSKVTFDFTGKSLCNLSQIVSSNPFLLLLSAR